MRALNRVSDIPFRPAVDLIKCINKFAVVLQARAWLMVMYCFDIHLSILLVLFFICQLVRSMDSLFLLCKKTIRFDFPIEL